MSVGTTQKIDAILKANGAKGIGHLSVFERCQILALGNPSSKTQARKALRQWLEQFADCAKHQRIEEGGDGIEAA